MENTKKGVGASAVVLHGCHGLSDTFYRVMSDIFQNQAVYHSASLPDPPAAAAGWGIKTPNQPLSAPPARPYHGKRKRAQQHPQMSTSEPKLIHTGVSKLSNLYPAT